jgi:hypothetical protein
MIISGHPLDDPGDDVMSKRTCAACDGELDGDPIEVRIRGKAVEVCCEDCAMKLKEASRFTERDASLVAEG